MPFVGTFKFAKNLSFLKVLVGDGFDIGGKKSFFGNKIFIGIDSALQDMFL